jgi:hypothetical protein
MNMFTRREQINIGFRNFQVLIFLHLYFKLCANNTILDTLLMLFFDVEIVIGIACDCKRESGLFQLNTSLQTYTHCISLNYIFKGRIYVREVKCSFSTIVTYR